jgi:hypothetical protein
MNGVRLLLLASVTLMPQLAAAQHGYYSPDPFRTYGYRAPYGVFQNGAISPRYYSGGFDGGLYGTYGGYQPLAIRPSGGSSYANPPYMSQSYSYPNYAPNFSLDGGVYSLGARRNLAPFNRVPPNRAPGDAKRAPAAGKTPSWPSRGEIKIVQPVGAVDEVHYALNGAIYTIKPGFTQTFADDRNWVIAFGSGGERGDLHYTLQAGEYRFVATPSGWDLKQVRPSPAAPAGE